MPRSSNHTRQFREINESILNHLFLSFYLPNCAEADFLIQSNHRYEYMILEFMSEFLNIFHKNSNLPVIQVLIDCSQRWLSVQKNFQISVSHLQKIVEDLSNGTFLPIYFHTQNAAILIEFDDDNAHQPLISSWQVLLPTSTIVSSIQTYISTFPVDKYRLPDRSHLSSTVHCELLIDFMKNTIEHTKAEKNSRQINDTREVAQSHYVCQWWIQQFSAITREHNSPMSVKFNKKSRDQIRSNNGLVPFRRSGLWMTIKVVFQMILTKYLGNTGTIIYKLLITQFLTYILHDKSKSDDSIVSTDLLIVCIRKILRRLNKIENLLSLKIDSNETIDQWIELVKIDIEKKIDAILPKNNWQITIQTEEEREKQTIEHDLNDTKHCQHSFVTLKHYLNNDYTKMFNRMLTKRAKSIVSHMDNIELSNTIDSSLNNLGNQSKYRMETSLSCMEVWIQSWCDGWMAESTSDRKETEKFEMLFRFYKNYWQYVLNSIDSISYSRFLLTSLTILQAMHYKLCEQKKFEELKTHRIDCVNDILDLFEYLTLPNRNDMIRARYLYDYFSKFKYQSYPDLFATIDEENSFGVRFASKSTKMLSCLEKIQKQVEHSKNEKIKQVQNAKDRYHRLVTAIIDCPCTCYNASDRQCRRCRVEEQAQAIKVEIYESPIPSERTSALAVIFELRMPNEIRCYRDILWMFANRFHRTNNDHLYQWLNIRPHSEILKQYYTGPNDCQVKLVSSTKALIQTEFCYPSIASASIDDFIHDNSLSVQISPVYSINFENECRRLTPEITDPNYKRLQYSILSTEFVQNQVLTDPIDLQQKLSANQYIEFGSFRSGHRLQWWNLLTLLEMDSLQLNDETVNILILHSIMQYGPIVNESKMLKLPWCPESHEILLQDHFLDEMLIRLNRHLDHCASNWQNNSILLLITMITSRILTICNSNQENKFINLLLRCRRISDEWLESISKLDFNQIENLRLKIINIAIACIYTYSTHAECIEHLLSTNEHIVSLLVAISTIHDNVFLHKKHMNMSLFQKNLLKFSSHILVQIQPTFGRILHKFSYEGLNKFAIKYWAAIKSNDTINIQWKKRCNSIYDGWYDGQYESTELSIDCLHGIFLINGMTIDYLPEKFVSNELYIRTFEQTVFQVQIADKPNTYITKNCFDVENSIRYEFHFDDQNYQLVVYERNTKTNDIFELLPMKLFENELPFTFVNEYSHWKNVKSQIIEFRPVRFQDSDFYKSKPYLLDIETGLIYTNDQINRKILINQSSSLYDDWFQRYFVRLDEQPYVYMMKDDDLNLIHIYLSRLGIAFKYDRTTNCFTSREYADMNIDENQWLGTLTGLKSGLLLSPAKVSHHSRKCFPFRKLIVPYGYVHATRQSLKDHQIVMIQRKSTMLYAYQYFVFVLNDRLRIIQSTDSPAGWLYLALLHGLTSNCLPDQYTKLTGMERAFQLLNSAGSWSDQPYDSLSLEILRQIARISPKTKYYQHHPILMEEIDWNCHSIPYSLQHFGYYLIVKQLIRTSEKLNFMHLSSHSNDILKLIDENQYNERLLWKLYYDYRHSYNPIARLSNEEEISVEHEPLILENDIITKNHTSVHLVNDIYHNGDVQFKDVSELSCFPLSKWFKDEFQFKSIWIGLLKDINSKKLPTIEQNNDEHQRLKLLLSFLYYIPKNRGILSFCLEMLNTVLLTPSFSLQNISFPALTKYYNIQQISVTANAINFNSNQSVSKRRTIIEEVRKCFENDSTYKNICGLATSEEKNQIKFLLRSWQLNRKLHTFLIDVQNLICSIDIIRLNMNIKTHCQQARRQNIVENYEIKIKSKERQIKKEILFNAQEKYFRTNSKSFIKSKNVHLRVNQSNEFPSDIFSSIDEDNYHLHSIENYFKEHLQNSWKQYQSNKIYQNEFFSNEEMIEQLESLHNESIQLWQELVQSLTISNERLFEIGLLPRITPTVLIMIFQQIWFNEKHQISMKSSFLTKDQCTLLGGLIVNWIIEQQIERALHFVCFDKRYEYERELTNIPHTNWIPSEQLTWLIFELEMNITIRAIQVDVARHMIEPHDSSNNNSIRNSVMQMNMGEGKTSIIIPMLALSLSSPTLRLVRVILLKSLLPMNYQSLKFKFGGLLNRRVCTFVCRRDMDFNDEQTRTLFQRLQQGLSSCDVMLVSPEDILSFDLLTIDKCRRNEFDIARSMLSIHRWLKAFVRDVLDESDEILHCKYQLVYTVGTQQSLDGGIERWKCIQLILSLVKQFVEDIVQTDPDDIYYQVAKRKSAFPEFRLLSHEVFVKFSLKIVNEWLNRKSYRQNERKLILSFILDTNITIDEMTNLFSEEHIQLFLIIRGLFSAEVLFIALRKRYRVNYGINMNSNFNRLMAVPFRAKDVPTERTEFGHPDTALILTQLSYYYSGLSHAQILQCFDRLNKDEREPDSIYAEWIAQEDLNDIPQHLKQWKSVNIENSEYEINQIFHILRYNMLVIDYFLNHFVFPREAKQFPHKLISSAWDLSSPIRTNIITGFSGTNDTQLLLPIHIQQCDLPQLAQTDAIVINNLLRIENENYQNLSMNVNSDRILYEIMNSKFTINVILDVGALFVDGTNRDIAMHWLKLSDRTMIDYAVYFESDCIYVCDRNMQHHLFATSPASERLDRCIVYLDEVHTRGTDFKFPNGFRAAVTLGNGLTKDRFVQACMRMRLLGKGHTLTFWSSNEVHRQIKSLKYVHDDLCHVKDILRWVYENTYQAIWDGLHHWAIQSLSYQRKLNAFENIEWTNHEQMYTNQIMEKIAEKCLEPEIIELRHMYGTPKIMQTISEIYGYRYQHLNIIVSEEFQTVILKRIYAYGGSKQRLSQCLDEEQEREIEQELEIEQERIQEHQKFPVQTNLRPCQPILHDEIKRLCDPNHSDFDLAESPIVFRPLSYAFVRSKFAEICQPNSWNKNFWISTEFQRVIENEDQSLDLLLRPPRWIIIYQNKHVIFISPFEANWLIGELKLSTTTLRLLLPRLKKNQSNFVNVPSLIVPYDIDVFQLPLKWLVQLLIFNGTIYFETLEEQTAYCECLALCLKPRTVFEEKAYEDHWISVDGFVKECEHRHELKIHDAQFNLNPLAFLKELIKTRNNSYPSVTSHLGNVIFNVSKSFLSETR